MNSGVNVPDLWLFVVVQKSPVIRHRKQRTVGDSEYFVSLCAVEHATKINHSGGEVEVGEVDLCMQLHHILLRMSQVNYVKILIIM